MHRLIIRFLRFPARDRKILLKAGVLLWVVRIGLWVLPFQRLRELLSRRTQSRVVATDVNPALIEEITMSVKRVRRYVPAATCLAQALVTIKLLEEAGLPAAMRIGVARNTEGKLEAHAWVESEGRVVIGGAHTDLSRFTILHTVEGT